MNGRQHSPAAHSEAPVPGSGQDDGQCEEYEVPEPTADELRAARQYFGDRQKLAERFVEHLCTTGIEHGLLGPREVPRMWSRHLLNCAALAPELPPGGDIADVGSGAGLPGIALAIARPDCHVTMVEPMERRIQWMDTVAKDLGLENVELIRARAEEVTDEVMADVVTARAVSSLKTLIPMTAPLMAEDARLMLLKGRSAQDEIAAAHKVIQKHKLARPAVHTLGDGVLETPTTVVVCSRR